MKDRSGKRGRPALPAAVAADRRARWRQAMAFSGLTADEAAKLIGRSRALVWSYGSANGDVPTEAAIRLMEDYCRKRAQAELDRLQRMAT